MYLLRLLLVWKVRFQTDFCPSYLHLAQHWSPEPLHTSTISEVSLKVVEDFYHFANLEWKIKLLSNSIFAGSNIVYVPKNHTEDCRGYKVAEPSVKKCKIIRCIYRFIECCPCHSTRTIYRPEPNQNESTNKVHVWNQSDGHFGSCRPGIIIFRRYERRWNPGSKVKYNTKSNG